MTELGLSDPSVYASAMGATTRVELTPDEVRMAIIQYAAATGRVIVGHGDGSAYVDFEFGEDDEDVGASVYFVRACPGAMGEN